MASENPFQSLFETIGRLPTSQTEGVNRKAYEKLCSSLTVPLEQSGRCILLRAPRAGHGKTHLLSRLHHQLDGGHEMIPLHATLGSQITASSLIDDTLRRLFRQLMPFSSGLCALDILTRRLFSLALLPLVRSGDVPCEDREEAAVALRYRPIETFDFHHPNAITAHWTRENFDVLGQRLSVVLARRGELPVRGVAFWVDLLFRFAVTPADNPLRLKNFSDMVHGQQPVESEQMERLEALLGMISQLKRVVLVADELEGLSTDESAALKLAAFIGKLRQGVDRLDVILSMNRDIWESAFLPRLSSGLADRLSEVLVDLEPLTESEILALLESRAPGYSWQLINLIDREKAGTSARGIIREAAVAWEKITPGLISPPEELEPAPPIAVVALPSPAQPEPIVEVLPDVPAELPPTPPQETIPQEPIKPKKPKVTLPDAHRVDELLQEFRKRHGRKSG